ncbi:MAG: pullulanase-associated domain-containing protein, partial [Candidatus Neomarinimicrobiota bacterium]
MINPPKNLRSGSLLPGLILAGILVFSLKGAAEMKTLTIHYHRYDQAYQGWTLWVWANQVTTEISAVKTDDYGLIFHLDLTNFPPNHDIGLLPKIGNWEKKDDPNRYWTNKMQKEIWILQGEATVYYEKPDTSPKIRGAFLDSPTEIKLIFSNAIAKKTISSLNPVVTLKDGQTIKPSKLSLYPESSDSSEIVRLLSLPPLDVDQLPATIATPGFKNCPLHMRHILDEKKYISSEPLGAFYSS